MYRPLSALKTSLLAASGLACILTVACATTTDTGTSEPATKDKPAGDSGLTVPTPVGTLPTPGVDSGTPVGDAALPNISGPSFDLSKVNTIEGTFVTDKAPVNGIQTNATVTWAFKIQSITPPPSSTAKWSATATNVVGGNISDFPPVAGLSLSLQQAPSPAQFEFYAADFGTPRNYVLIQHGESRILEFHFYRRLIDDGETQPVADKPRNIVYTVK